MKKVVVLAIGLLISSAAFAAGRAALQADKVIGSWDITIQSPNGTNNATLNIKNEGGKLTGAIKSPRGERPLDSVSVSGSDIKMVMKANVQGNEMIFTYTGKVENNSMKGDVDFGGMATGSWSAVPHKDDGGSAAPAPAASQGSGANISGDWNFTVETQAGSGSPTFSFKQQGETLTGSYKGQFGEAPLTGTVKGSDINFTIKINAQGQELTVTYSGKIENKDSMKGTVKLGEMGEGTWSGKRKS